MTKPPVKRILIDIVHFGDISEHKRVINNLFDANELACMLTYLKHILNCPAEIRNDPDVRCTIQTAGGLLAKLYAGMPEEKQAAFKAFSPEFIFREQYNPDITSDETPEGEGDEFKEPAKKIVNRVLKEGMH